MKETIDGIVYNKEQLAELAVTRALYMVDSCRRFKEPRLATIAKYRNLYAGNVKKKFRQPFNVVVPVFAGAIDTLQAAFNDDISIEYSEQEEADYVSAKKITRLFDQEATSTAPNAKFAQKMRWDRGNAIFSGRGFATNYGRSIPKYSNNLEIFELEDAIFQPMGGGHLENHLYAGRENIVRSASQLKTGDYDKDQVKKLLEIAAKTDYYPVDDSEIRQNLAKFKAAGLDPKSSDYIGEQVFNLVEIALTINGTRYYMLFSPWYRIWLRFEKLSDLFSSNRYPWKSWATHEDNKNFLSKSFADDLYGVADAVHTLFNQELTNREKQNFQARAFDKDMFQDVAKLDAAQHRPDALVPADTKNGTRTISAGIYEFKTPELKGTISLIDWMNAETGKDIGVTELSMGGVQQASKRASVVFAEQQNISKRLMFRSAPYTEFIAEIGHAFIESLKDHMPAKMALKRLGSESTDFTEITRVELDTHSDLDVKITSSALEMRSSQLKKEARMKVLDEISNNPAHAQLVNPRAVIEEKLRSGAEMKDNEIAIIMDTQNYGSKEETSFAHKAIQDILAGEKPDQYFGATTLFLQIIFDYARNYRSKIGEKKYIALVDYVNSHEEIVKENLERKARAQAISIGGGAQQINPQKITEQPATSDVSGAISSAMEGVTA